MIDIIDHIIDHIIENNPGNLTVHARVAEQAITLMRRLRGDATTEVFVALGGISHMPPSIQTP